MSRLFLNADKTKVVGEDDPDARFLLVAGEHDEIPAEYADLVKAATKPANKQAAKPANKSAKVAEEK